LIFIFYANKKIAQHSGHLTLGILQYFHLCLQHGAGKHFSLDSRPGQAGFEFFLLPNRIPARQPPLTQTIGRVKGRFRFMVESHSTFSKSYVVVVSGSVGSGKSTITTALSKILGGAPVLIFDHYGQYIEWPQDVEQWINDGADPNHIRVPKLKDDLLSLLAGRTIIDPQGTNVLSPSKYILLEEPSGRERQEIREYIDLVVYIDVPQDVCVTRLVERAVDMKVWNSKGTFQGETKKDLVRQLNAVVLWMTQYQRARSMYIQVSQIVKENADIIVNGLKAVDEITTELVSILNNKQGKLNLPGE
jgi:uridine kinase